MAENDTDHSEMAKIANNGEREKFDSFDKKTVTNFPNRLKLVYTFKSGLTLCQFATNGQKLAGNIQKASKNGQKVAKNGQNLRAELI